MTDYTGGSRYLSLIEKKCLFCGKASTDKDILRTDAGWGLCHDCIKTFHESSILQQAPEVKNEFDVYYTPKDIVAYLDKYIVGQAEAKKTLALAAYQNYKLQTDTTSQRPTKANVLLLGPTGSGKTALVEHLANFLGVPFHIHDATQLTETGYVGGEVEDMLEGLWLKADKDVNKAQHGIIVIDEVDKIRSKSESGRDITGAAVQRSLLKTLESNIVGFSEGRNRNGSQIMFDTTNVLFIAAGAFSGLSEIIQRRTNKDSSGIGFGAEIKPKDKTPEFDDIIKSLDTDDLVQYGFMPEFLGRFTSITHTDSITKDIMLRILKEPKNSALKQVTRLLELDGVELLVTEEAKESISDMAFKHKTGARALRGILNGVLKDAMFDYPSNSDILSINIEIIDNELKVVMKDKDNEKVPYGVDKDEGIEAREGERKETTEQQELSDEEWLDTVLSQEKSESDKG